MLKSALLEDTANVKAETEIRSYSSNEVRNLIQCIDPKIVTIMAIIQVLSSYSTIHYALRLSHCNSHTLGNNDQLIMRNR